MILEMVRHRNLLHFVLRYISTRLTVYSMMVVISRGLGWQGYQH